MQKYVFILFGIVCWSAMLMIGILKRDEIGEKYHWRSGAFIIRYLNLTAPEESDQTRKKNFAIYIMTEECIPDYFLEDIAFGNQYDHDVYVLSFKKECSKNFTSHVTHIFRPRTTWTTGRNALYFYVKRLRKIYQYHIFMDDDVYLYYTDYYYKYVERVKPSGNPFDHFRQNREHEKAMRQLRNNMSALKFFEQSLLEYSPAVSVVNLGHAHHWLTIKSFWGKKCAPNTEMPMVTPTFFIDANFIAYHHEAIPLLMPHNPVSDKISWWLSAVYLMQRVKSLFYRQCIGIWQVSVLNSKARPYPRNAFPNNYLDIYWNTTEGKQIRDLIDIRDRDFVMFYADNGKFGDVYFGNPGICTAPLKYPISKHYRLLATS